MSPRLRCKLVSDLDVLNDKDDNKRTIWLTPDNDKSTSFSIDKAIEDSLKEAPKPCFLVIDCYHKDSGVTVPFFYGGMDMISNSRNIESYSLGQDKDNDVPSLKNLGEYWQTHQGSKRDDDTSSECMKEFYQSFILPPSSKPLTIKCLTLKLLSLRPAKCNVGYIKQIKIKAKLPDVNDTVIPTSNSKGEAISNGGNEQRSQHAQSQPMETIVDSIQDQIPHAIRALTVMIESVRNSVEASASNALGEIEKKAFAKDQQNGLMMHSIQNSLNDLKDSVNELTNEIRLLRNQEEQRVKCLLAHDELADDRVAKEKESFQALMKEERKQIMEEIKMQQETFFEQIVSRFDFRPKDQEVSKSQEIQAEECNLTHSSSEDASCNLRVEE